MAARAGHDQSAYRLGCVCYCVIFGVVLLKESNEGLEFGNINDI